MSTLLLSGVSAAQAQGTGQGTGTGNGQGNGQGKSQTAPPAQAPTKASGTQGPVSSPQNPTQPSQNAPGSVQKPRNDDPNYDLARTIREAQDSSSSVLEARRNVQISEQRANEAAAEGKPNLTGSANATRFDAATKLSVGGGPPITVLENHTEQATIAITQRLDLLGQVRAATNQARLQALSDRFTVEQASDERALQATNLYYSLLRAEHQVQVAESALKAATAQRDTAKKLYEGQVGQKIDLLRAETDVAQSTQEVERARNDREIARAAFNDLVGRPLDLPVNLKDVPGANVGADIKPNEGQKIGENDFTPFTPPTTDLNGLDVNKTITDAQTLRPEILAAAVRVRVEETGIKLARAGQEPTFTLSASGNYYPTTSFQAPRQKTAGVTAAVSIPFYDGGATRAKVNASRLRTENAKTAVDSAKSDVALQVRQAYLNVTTAARQIQSANAALQQAIAARQLAQVRYEGQVGLYLEVTDAQDALVRAENAQVDAIYNYFIARAQFDYARGILRQTTTGTNTTP